jgi:NADH-quinone oxidoreductase subunit L
MESITPTLLLAIPALPLCAFLVQILIGNLLPREGDWVSLAAITGSFLLSLRVFYLVIYAYEPGFSVHYPFTWIDLQTFDITMGLYVDNLSAVMLMVVTGVGGLIHLYSVGYMEGDPGKYRFFAYLSLFSFSMLGIVLTDNLFGLFVFWELVGLCSFFLIGFWYEKPEAANASKKAFLTTRVGDLGMLLGIFFVLWTLGPHFDKPLAFETIFHAAGPGYFNYTLLTATGILLFFGAVGKSAQLPLHVWLPDAMEGPTPVSALIHAATMVAAGVYMVARLTPFFSVHTLLFIGYVGALTAFFAASVALVKNDIKKALAYSTVSQLGYMFLALGLGAYLAGTLHLTTHAIFKALLFMGSGSIIHAVHTQDMRDMGGLWKKMPITFITFGAATLAIAGIPFFSGFYSKEKILESAMLFGMTTQNTYIPYLHMLPAILGFLAAGMTAFYMFRIVFMTFFGEPGDEERVHHAHESPRSMTIPMAILAVFCFAFFFQAGPSEPGKTSHGETNQHAAVQQTDGLFAQSAYAAESTGHAEESADKESHGKSDEKHADSGGESGGHAGWFEALITNPDPVKHYDHKLHKYAKSMTAILSLTIAGAGIFLAAALYASVLWLPVTAVALAVLSLTVNWWLWIVLLGLASGIYLIREPLRVDETPESLQGLEKLLAAKYYFDEFYRDTFVKGTLVSANLSSWIDSRIVDGIVNGSGVILKLNAYVAGAIDNVIVDGLVNGVGYLLEDWGDRLRRLQTGQVQWYFNMIAFGLGAALLLSIIFF